MLAADCRAGEHVDSGLLKTSMRTLRATRDARQSAMDGVDGVVARLVTSEADAVLLLVGQD